MAVPSFALATTGPGLSTTSFNESDGCEDPAGFHGPRATRTGYLPDTEALYGPFGDTYGRTIADVKTQLVWWTVPGGNGLQVRVHALALPAFLQVTANLNAAAAQGKHYTIDRTNTYTFAQRTIGGRHQVSHHAIGTAIDINTTKNPYRGDNVLITDMPGWFVEAWTSAGFCWGGHWKEVKDPMHFAWKGPAYTPRYPIDLIDKAPISSQASWTQSVSAKLAWNLGHQAQFFARDGNRDGAVDAYRLRAWSGGTLIELSRSSKDYAICGVWREWSPADAEGTLILADYDNTSRLDLWELDLSGATVGAEIWLQRDDFQSSVTQATSIPVTTGMAFEAADFDDDGLIDIAVARPGSTTEVEIWSGASGYTTTIAASSVGLATTEGSLGLSVADIDRDDLPDLAVVNRSGTAAQIVVQSTGSGLSTQLANIQVSSGANLVEVAFGEYDGDGRADVVTLDASGTVRSFLGGTVGGGVILNNWFRDPEWTCPDDADIDLPDEIGLHIARISGSDRYTTSARLSRTHFAAADTVVVASGLDFPDALAASPVAASLGGPVLLTHRDWLPGAIRDEINRLGATRVIIAGGPGAVSAAVEGAIGQLPGVTTVDRAFGPDRYGTAAALAKLMPAPTVVYVATGANYPDALAAAPAAAADGAPILLVAQTGIPQATRDVLETTAWTEIVVLGGSAAVSSSIASQLSSFGSVTRLAGADRYATAVEIAKRLSSPQRAFVVSGQGFADAVGAGAAAASVGAPIILATSEYVPSSSASFLANLRASKLTVVGGVAAISELVRANLIELVYPN